MYQTNCQLVHAGLARMGIAPADIEDATQEVFVIAFKKRDEFRKDCSQKTWLLAIARRVAANMRRKTRVDVELSEEQEGDLPSPFDVVVEQEASSRVWHLIKKLPKDRQEVFVLSELQELSGSEIAMVTGLEPATVYWRVRTARREFGALLQREEAHDAWKQVRTEIRAEQESTRLRSWSPLFSRLSETAGTAPAYFFSLSPTLSHCALALLTVLSIPALRFPHSNDSSPRSTMQLAPVAKSVTAASTDEEAPQAAQTKLRRSQLEPIRQESEPHPLSKIVSKRSRTRAALKETLREEVFVSRVELAQQPRITRDSRAAASGATGIVEDADTAGSDISAELELLQEASRLRLRGSADVARQLLRRHKVEFPKGVLRKERNALLAQLDCTHAQLQELAPALRRAALSTCQGGRSTLFHKVQSVTADSSQN